MSYGATSERFARWEGEHLLVPPYGFIQTSHCAVCARPGPQAAQVSTYSQTPRATFLFFLFPMFWPLALLLAAQPRRQQVEVPLCLECNDKWRRATNWFWGLALLGVLSIPLAFEVLWDVIRAGQAWYPGRGAVAGLFVWGWGLLGFYALGVRRQHLICVRVDSHGTLLRVPNATLLQTAWQEDSPSDPVTRPE